MNRFLKIIIAIFEYIVIDNAVKISFFGAIVSLICTLLLDMDVSFFEGCLIAVLLWLTICIGIPLLLLIILSPFLILDKIKSRNQKPREVTN